MAEADNANIPVREFTLRSAFALSFSDISPIVGIYSAFGLGLATAGPAFFWAFPVVLIGQLLVAGVFGDLVSKWPFQGSVYAWTRELAGARLGWYTNWAYGWGLTLGLAFLGEAAAQNLLPAIGVNAPSKWTLLFASMGIIIFGSIANSIAGQFLKLLLYISMTCELLASGVIGFALLFFHRRHPFSILFSGYGTGHGLEWLRLPFLAMVAYIGWSFLGFEAGASIAEEVKESRKVLPKAIGLSLAAAGGLVMFACLGLILAVPDYGAIIAGTDTAPIATTLETALGTGVGRVFLFAVTIGFTASMIAVQAAVTRSIWATARDRALPFSHMLGRLGGRERIPRNSIALTAVIACGALLVNLGPTRAYALLLSFTNAGFYISYCMPLIALVVIRSRGKWSPGPVSMGRWSGPVSWAAAIWVTFEAINIAWPRAIPGQTWWLNWGLVLMSVGLGILGLGVSAWVFRGGSEAVTLETSEPTRDVEAT
jgi:amino acid transporter